MPGRGGCLGQHIEGRRKDPPASAVARRSGCPRACAHPVRTRAAPVHERRPAPFRTARVLPYGFRDGIGPRCPARLRTGLAVLNRGFVVGVLSLAFPFPDYTYGGKGKQVPFRKNQNPPM